MKDFGKGLDDQKFAFAVLNNSLRISVPVATARVDTRRRKRRGMLRGNHIGHQVGKPNRALNRSVMAMPDRTNELHDVTAAVASGTY